MLDQFAFFGIRATPRRQALRGLPRLNTWTASDLLSLAEALWDLPEREFLYVAVDLPAKYHLQLDLDNLQLSGTGAAPPVVGYGGWAGRWGGRETLLSNRSLLAL